MILQPGESCVAPLQSVATSDLLEIMQGLLRQAALMGPLPLNPCQRASISLGSDEGQAPLQRSGLPVKSPASLWTCSWAL